MRVLIDDVGVGEVEIDRRSTEPVMAEELRSAGNPLRREQLLDMGMHVLGSGRSRSVQLYGRPLVCIVLY